MYIYRGENIYSTPATEQHCSMFEISSCRSKSMNASSRCEYSTSVTNAGPCSGAGYVSTRSRDCKQWLLTGIDTTLTLPKLHLAAFPSNVPCSEVGHFLRGFRGYSSFSVFWFLLQSQSINLLWPVTREVQVGSPLLAYSSLCTALY